MRSLNKTTKKYIKICAKNPNIQRVMLEYFIHCMKGRSVPDSDFFERVSDLSLSPEEHKMFFGMTLEESYAYENAESLAAEIEAEKKADHNAIYYYPEYLHELASAIKEELLYD